MNATEINDCYMKSDLTVFDCKGMEGIELVQDSVQCGTVVQMVEYLQFRWKENFLYQLWGP